MNSPAPAAGRQRLQTTLHSTGARPAAGRIHRRPPTACSSNATWSPTAAFPPRTPTRTSSTPGAWRSIRSASSGSPTPTAWCRPCTTATATCSRWWCRFPRPTTSIGGQPTGIVFNGSQRVRRQPGRHCRAQPLPVRDRGRASSPAGRRTSIATHAIRVVDSSASGANYKGLALSADGDTPAALRDRLPQRARRRVRQQLPAGDAAAGRVPGPAASRGLRAVRHPGDRRRHLRHLRQAGREQERRSRRARAWASSTSTRRRGKLIRRVASRGALNAPWGIALAPARFGTLQQRAAGRQLRRRHASTPTSRSSGLLDGQPARQGRQPDPHRRTVGHAVRQRSRTTSRSTRCSSQPGPDDEEHGLVWATGRLY